MTKDEALRLALEALEDLARYEHPQTMIQIRKKDGGSIVTMYPHKVASDAITAIKAALEAKDEPVACWCHKCNENKLVNGIPFAMTRMILCPKCGNKRCPKASDHTLQCTNSNEPNQAGSVYTTPPQRTWVGLTDMEIDQGLCRTNYAMQTSGAWRDGVEWAEAKLKEKNT